MIYIYPLIRARQPPVTDGKPQGNQYFTTLKSAGILNLSQILQTLFEIKIIRATKRVLILGLVVEDERMPSPAFKSIVSGSIKLFLNG